MKKIQTRNEMRSGCPINLTLEMLGDRWSLIVIRDIMFGNRRHYGDLLRLSEEGIASNILANRLARLVIHMGAPVPRRSVCADLQAAFESAMSREANAPTSVGL